MGFFNQLLLLLWKNFTLRKRQKVRLVAEIIFPLALFLILVIVRVTKPDLKVQHDVCHFDGKAMPSAGILPFFQSFFCTFNNTCHLTAGADEQAGTVGSFDQAALFRIIEDMEKILNDGVDVELISDTLTDLNILGELYQQIVNGSTQGNFTLAQYVVDPAVIRQQILTQNLSITSDVLDWLLNATLNTPVFQTGVNSQSVISWANTLVPTLFVSDNDTIRHLQQRICNETALGDIFWFPNDTVRDDVHRELCNLSTNDFYTLAQDFEQNFNWLDFLNGLSNFTSINVGRDLTRTLEDFIQATITDPAWEAPLRDLASVIQQLAAQNQQNPAQNLNQMLSQTVCGRNGAFLDIDPDQVTQAEQADSRGSVNSNIPTTGQGSTTQSPMSSTTTPSAKPPNDKECGKTSPECNATLNALDQTKGTTNFLWRQIKPFVRGCILYYPQNPATEKIVANARTFFEDLERIKELAVAWEDFSPELYNILNNSAAVDTLRAIVGEENICSFGESLLKQRVPGLNFPGSACSFLETYLDNTPRDNSTTNSTYDWRDSLEALDMVFKLIANYSQCFNFDKFKGYTNHDEMIDDGLTLIDQNLFWSVVEFENMDTSTSTVPTHVSYKIRMDTDKVDSTKRVQDKYPKPGPRREPWKLKYFMYGFVFIQDMIEHAIIKVQTGIGDDKPGVGIFTQQFPYPCYVEDKYYRPGPRRRPAQDLKYFTFGFAYIQDMIEHAIIQQQTGMGGESRPGVGIFTQQFPYPCYTQDKFIYAISRMLPLFMILAWILTTAMLCKSIVYEKERRLKEVMKMMGLGNGVHWMAWFINAFIMMFITILLLVGLLKGGKVLEHSDASCVLFFITVFSVATIVKCFLISVFFSRPNMAACCAGFIYFLLYLPYMLLVQFDDVLTRSIKMAVSLSSNVAFGYGCNFIALWEEQAEGLQWSNMAISPVTDDDFNMLDTILMMMIDTLIYALFTWYIEAVFPGQYGIPKPFYFPFTKSYWCGTSGDFDESSFNSQRGIELNGQNANNMEAEPENKKIGVAIRNLVKKYSSAKLNAVDGLSLNFYEDQITSFLGHNGAGKTTTMSILTGLFTPTEGTAFIHGEDIRTRMDHIRHSLGTCPQHNVLFDLLTVDEHLWFYARLKGAESKQVKSEMKQMIKDVGLPHKRDELSQNLSGGMKRKLSVAIAFVGNSKTVILDEPTAGVDPYARRAIWQLLLKLKQGRTIILSTHHMDEADVLGDRIAIISLGRLCCVGSSLFLKNRYGNGYYLTLVRDDQDIDEDEVLKQQLMQDPTRPVSAGSVRTITSVLPSVENEDEGYADGKSDSDPPTPPPEGATYNDFSIKKITAFIQKHVTQAELVEDNMTELCYRLPDAAAHNGDFEKLFLDLEHSQRNLGISSFGISDTSLEEVFLKVTEENAEMDPPDEVKRKKLDEMSDGGRMPRGVSRLSFRRKKKLSLFGRRSSRVDSKAELMADEDTDSVISGPVSDYGENGFSHGEHHRVTGWALTLRQFIAIFLKRFHHTRRSKKGFLVEIVLPVIFILLAMVFALITPPFSEEPALELHPWHYEPRRGDPHLNMFYSNDKHDSPLAQQLETFLQTKPGVGNRCVNKHHINGYPCEPVPQQSFAQTPPTNISLPCDCKSTGWQDCPDDAAGPSPPSVLLSTTDHLKNMTGRDISDWILKTHKKYKKRRYGGLSFGELDDLAVVTNATQVRETLERLLTAANNGTLINLGNLTTPNFTFFESLAEVLPTLAVRDSAKVWFNNKGWAASVSFINVMNNLILRSNLPSGVNPADYGITAINHPMELTKEQLNDEALYASFKDIVIAICVIFAMSFIPASFTMYLIEERMSNSKHLQFVSGVKPVMYWVSNFCWDMVNYIIPCVLCIFIFLAFNKPAYVSATNGPCLVSLLLLYGWSMIPLMYPFSRAFDVPSTALVTLKSVNIFLGTTATMATFILEFLEEDDEGLKDINKILKQVFLLLPQYCLGRGLFDMAKNQLFADVYERLGFGNGLPNPFDWDQVGRNLFSMFMLGILFFIINLLIEYNFFIRSRVLKPSGKPLDDEDEDVAKERQRVMSGGAKDDVLRLEQLTKEFRLRGKLRKMTAVDRLCVGVPKGQCFGLLGVNGAGKTTTFKMLTGDERLTRGNAYVNNYSILNEMVQVRSSIGYCPQFDALDPLLTGVEHLRFYARLRGIPESNVKGVADWAIRRLGLLPHANKISTNYSGGNKRKLSTAIALIGNPSIIFLDEPTTGMDPGARRFLWDCITCIVKDGRSVILTSHSMEECEALCGRLAIMVNGRFRCMGSIQHLKNRFGDGYTVIIRVSGASPQMEPVMEFFQSEFPESVLKEKHHNMLQYQLGSDVKLSTLFGQIEAVRERLNIEDYSVSQTTLDQVFINFAKLQTDLEDDEIEEPEDLTFTNKTKAAPIEGEEQSLAGSTVGLIRHDRHSPREQKHDADSLHLTNMQREPSHAAPVRMDGNRDAPIISLPYQMTDGADSLSKGDNYGIEDEVLRLPRKRGRPVAKFDDDLPDPDV